MNYTYDEACARVGLTRARLWWLVATMRAAGIAVGVQATPGVKNIVFSEDDIHAMLAWQSTQSHDKRWQQPKAVQVEEDGYITPLWAEPSDTP